MEKIICSFGNYPQDFNRTVTPIEWQVLKQEGNKALLITKAMSPLFMRPFDSKSNVWADSEIRRWLNGEFLDTAFTDDEKAAIYETELPDVGTKDKVFLLSIEEAETLYKNDKERGIWQYWLLRSPGVNPSFTAEVLPGGALSGLAYYYINKVVRPALWVDLDFVVFKS